MKTNQNRKRLKKMFKLTLLQLMVKARTLIISNLQKKWKLLITMTLLKKLLTSFRKECALKQAFNNSFRKD